MKLDKCVFCNFDFHVDEYLFERQIREEGQIKCPNTLCYLSNVTYFFMDDYDISLYGMEIISNIHEYRIEYYEDMMYIDKRIFDEKLKFSYTQIFNCKLKNVFDPIITPSNYKQKMNMLLTFS